MPKNLKKWRKRVKEKSVPDVAAKIASLLKCDDFFCLWLKGPLGAGKTTMAGDILRYFGLASRTPVTSPTFTYLNEYKIEGKWYAHLDFYRLGDGALSDPAVILGDRPFAGLLIEWPEKLLEKHADKSLLEPTHILEISYTEMESERLFEFSEK